MRPQRVAALRAISHYAFCVGRIEPAHGGTRVVMTVTPFASHAPMHRLSAVPSSQCITTTPASRASPTEPHGPRWSIDVGRVSRAKIAVVLLTQNKPAHENQTRSIEPAPAHQHRAILTAIIDCGSKLTELCKFCIRFRPARKLLFDRFRDQGQSWEVGVVETVSPCSFPDALNRV